MKNKSIIVIVVIVLIIGCILLFLPKNNGEHYIKEDKTLYESAVEYLKEEDKKQKNDTDKEDYKFFIAYDGFGMTEKGQNKYAYMWVLGDGYYLKDGKKEFSHGYSMFFKFTFKNGKVLGYENASDGSEYIKSVKKMSIDSKMSEKIINYDLKFSNDEEIDSYYSDKVKEG